MKTLCIGLTLSLLLWCLPAGAFVERLDPSVDVRIHCHQLRSALTLYIDGTFSGPQLQNALEAQYLTPYGASWSATDLTDNGNLVNLIDAQSTTAEKIFIALKVESLCAAWEEGFAAVDTAVEFRSLLGIPAP